jgi:hypothetical protein
VAAKLLEVPDFTRNGLDGKKLANRFSTLLTKHKEFQASSKYQSGIEEEMTPKIVLLDELLQLHEDALARKSIKSKSRSDEKANQANTANYIREKAKQRLGKRQADESVKTSETTPQKKNYILDIHTREMKLEEDKLVYKRIKLEKESLERQKDRDEREKDREDRRLAQEIEQKRSSDMMSIVLSMMQSQQERSAEMMSMMQNVLNTKNKQN